MPPKAMRVTRYLLGIGALVLAATALCGCARGERPFRLVGLCVESDAGIDELKRELATIARSQNMKLIDDSEVAKRDLDDVGYLGKRRNKDDPVVTVVLDREDGLGLGVTNVGLSPHQFAFGFSAGRDVAEANRFAEEVIARLSARWKVQDAPKGSGVLYSEGCH
jgi:hypothetical protein